jgi:8-oxo-dGTP pyrophosphatase MutT (NUDIX family)
MDKFAGVILITNENKILLQRRNNKPGIDNPGKVALFGGGINPDEEPISAAVREIQEELCLELEKNSLEFFQEYHKTVAMHGRDVINYIFIAKNINLKDVTLLEGDGVILISSRDDLENYDLTITARDVLTEYFSKNA